MLRTPGSMRERGDPAGRFASRSPVRGERVGDGWSGTALAGGSVGAQQAPWGEERGILQTPRVIKGKEAQIGKGV